MTGKRVAALLAQFEQKTNTPTNTTTPPPSKQIRAAPTVRPSDIPAPVINTSTASTSNLSASASRGRVSFNNNNNYVAASNDSLARHNNENSLSGSIDTISRPATTAPTSTRQAFISDAVRSPNRSGISNIISMFENQAYNGQQPKYHVPYATADYRRKSSTASVTPITPVTPSTVSAYVTNYKAAPIRTSIQHDDNMKNTASYEFGSVGAIAAFASPAAAQPSSSSHSRSASVYEDASTKKQNLSLREMENLLKEARASQKSLHNIHATSTSSYSDEDSGNENNVNNAKSQASRRSSRNSIRRASMADIVLEQERLEKEREEQAKFEQKQEEIRRLEEIRRIEEEKLMEERRRIDENQRLIEENQRRIEEQRRLEEFRRMEEQRLIDEQRRLEEDRRRQKEEEEERVRQMEIQRQIELQRQQIEAQRQLEEQQRLLEEQQRLLEEQQRRQAEEERVQIVLQISTPETAARPGRKSSRGSVIEITGSTTMPQAGILQALVDTAKSSAEGVKAVRRQSVGHESAINMDQPIARQDDAPLTMRRDRSRSSGSINSNANADHDSHQSQSVAEPPVAMTRRRKSSASTTIPTVMEVTPKESMIPIRRRSMSLKAQESFAKIEEISKQFEVSRSVPTPATPQVSTSVTTSALSDRPRSASGSSLKRRASAAVVEATSSPRVDSPKSKRASVSAVTHTRTSISSSSGPSASGEVESESLAHRRSTLKGDSKFASIIAAGLMKNTTGKGSRKSFRADDIEEVEAAVARNEDEPLSPVSNSDDQETIPRHALVGAVPSRSRKASVVSVTDLEEPQTPPLYSLRFSRPSIPARRRPSRSNSIASPDIPVMDVDLNVEMS